MKSPDHGRNAPENRPSASVIPFRNRKPTPSIPLDVLDSLDKIHADLINVITRFPREEATRNLHWGWVAPLCLSLKFLQVAEGRAREIARGVPREFGVDPDGLGEVGEYVASCLAVDGGAGHGEL